MGDFTNKINKNNNQKNMQPQQQQQVNIDINKSKLVKCECGSPYYQQVVIFREVSGILVGQAGKNVQTSMYAMICMECKKPHVGSLPYLKDTEMTEEKEAPKLEIINK